MSRSRLGMSAILLFALSAFVVAQEPKKDAQPPKDPGKVDPKPADPKQPTPPAGDGKRFEFRFEKDKKFYQEQETSVQQIIKAQGQDLTQKQSSKFWFEYTPVDNKDGKWTVKQRVEGLAMSIDISGNQINYNSTQPDNPSTGNPGLTEFFKKLVGAEFTATIDKDFKVEKVDGAKEFIASVAAGSQQMDTLLRRILTDDALKEMCDPTKNIVPDAPKKAGESWTKTSNLSLGPIGSYTVTYKFTYIGPDKDLDKIDVETTLKYVAPDGKKDGAGDGLLFRIKSGELNSIGADGKPGPGKGTVYYNPKSGRLDSADINIKLKGELTVTIGGTDTKVELEQEQKTTVRTGETSLMPAKKG
ncbi:MAG TPA: DUF6263 family protein [Gemmata sp.]|nr:DUF6263 family protein [Gemmata sp.]